MSTKYQPLVDHLVASGEPVVWLTFDEIEHILQTELPPTARTGTLFWTRREGAHVRAWRAQGWQAHSTRRGAFVIFTRDAEERHDE